jgi:hypothetical protein
MSSSLVGIWRSIILGDTKSWVLFENGTCVILIKPDNDLAAQALALMKEWGSVHPGCSAGDFSVVHLASAPGLVVTGHHNDILSYVAPEDVDKDAEDVVIGLLGRAKRGQDAEELKIIHIEDKRAPQQSLPA